MKQAVAALIVDTDRQGELDSPQPKRRVPAPRSRQAVSSGLFGQYRLAAEAPVLSTQTTGTNFASANEPLAVLAAPSQVVAARLLLAVGWRLHKLARGISELVSRRVPLSQVHWFRREVTHCLTAEQPGVASGRGYPAEQHIIDETFFYHQGRRGTDGSRS